MGQRKKILVSSYSFAPDHGSESELAWRFVSQLKEFYEVVVCTNITYRQFFSEGLLRRLKGEGVEVKFVRLRGWQALLVDFAPARRIYYYLWQRALPQWVSRNCKLTEIDLIHHVSWATYTSPSFLWRLQKPLFIGPVGGGECFPWAFARSFRFRTQVYEWLRASRIRLARFQGAVKSSLTEAAVVWCANPETLEKCRLIAPDADLRLKSQVSLPDAVVDPLVKSPSDELVIVTVARLIPVKRVDLIVEAFFKAEGIKGKLVVIGDGEELGALKRQASKGKNPEREVIFKGWLERDDLLEELRRADLFAFASLHDSASFAVLEALSVGLPVVCLKIGGPAFLVGESAGCCIEAQNDEEAVRLFAETFVRLAKNPQQLALLSTGALQRARDFTGEQSFKDFLKVYEEVLAECEG